MTNTNTLLYGSITGFIIGFMWPKVRRWRERRRKRARAWMALAKAVVEVEQKFAPSSAKAERSDNDHA